MRNITMSTTKTQSENQAFWQNHVQQWQSTGLSQAAYCREHQLNQDNFGYHKRKQLSKVISSQNNGFVSVHLAQNVQSIDSLTLHFVNGTHLSGITSQNVTVVKQLMEAFA